MRVLASALLVGAFVAGALLALRTALGIWHDWLHLVLLVAPRLFGFHAAAQGVVWGTFLASAATGLLLLLNAFDVARALARKQEVPCVGLRLAAFFYVSMGCTALNVLVFSSAVAHGGPFRVPVPILAESFATLALGAFGWWAIRAGSQPFQRAPRVRRIAHIVCMNVTVGLVCLEVGLQVLSAYVAIPILVTDQSSAKIRRNAERLIPGDLHFGFPVNRAGHYDTEFKPRSERSGPTVVSIGDSFSYGAVPHGNHYSTVIERELSGVEIYNLGFPGIGPADYLHLLEGTGLPLDPDLVLIQIFVGNDFGDTISDDDTPRWVDADRYALGVLWHRLWILARADRFDWAAAPDAHGNEPDLAFLADPMLEVPHISEGIFLSIERRNAEALGVERPIAYRFFFEAIDRILLAAGDVPIAFVLIPDEFQIEDDLWAMVSGESDLELDRFLPQEKALEGFAERGVPVLDLLPVLRAVEPLEDGQRHLYHLRNTHFNTRGNAFAGVAMAAFAERLLADAEHPISLPLPLFPRTGSRVTWLTDGWGRAEDGLIWSDGPESRMIIPNDDSGDDLELGIGCLPYSFGDAPTQRIQVTFNGVALPEIALIEGRNDVRIALPRGLFRHRANELAFHYSHTTQPRAVDERSNDERELAVGIYGITLRRTHSS